MKTVRWAMGPAVLAVALGMTACGTAGQSGEPATPAATGTAATGAAGGFKIGLLLPESKTARYEKFDRPLITEEVTALCPTCEVVYTNANQDPNQQQQQVDSMLTNNVKVLILDAVDAKAIASSVVKAKQQGVKVVAYDRLASGPIDAYTSFDNVQVGKMQGEALLAALKEGGDPKRGPIVMINGSPTDPNAGDFKKGAHSVLDGQVTVGKEYDTPDWSPDQANTQATGAFTALGADKVIGIYSANDGMAGGIARAMQNAGVPKGTPLTGQDAELAGIQRILLGTQTMTIYKPIRPEAKNAAQLAVDLGSGKTVQGTGTVDNGSGSPIPAMIIQPIVVDKDNIKDTVVKDGFWKAEEICTADVQAACQAAGIS
ncbi:sugar ABC transporter substrate-binding protein [Planomonospora venezuelensis]|uniref:D-xylose transport system substrate-binding protein n=1 Tax=Planomonospora venezuelensis TaxID=1999 RepID=A0A841D7E2_PLAVE|nr:substrate-binding domain-containing protein [Planomonospora venezuelensis]MBB5965389.1 D-xylose transport system substrate-binding protein [Planomonospora venezuelensis]GIN05158.1 solute-binding protein [Planomonospora venezuelensis]